MLENLDGFTPLPPIAGSLESRRRIGSGTNIAVSIVIGGSSPVIERGMNAVSMLHRRSVGLIIIALGSLGARPQ